MPAQCWEVRRDIDRVVHNDLEDWIDAHPSGYVVASRPPGKGWTVEIWNGPALVALNRHKRLGIAFLSAVAEAKGVAA